MSDKDQAVELLRQFANFQSAGIRGVVQMRGLQQRAQVLLARIDKKKTKKVRNEQDGLCSLQS